MIHTGDCVTVMRSMPADSVDAVVTDPPYGLEFMGKEWDKFAVSATTKRSGWDHTGGGGAVTSRDEARDFPSDRRGSAGFHKRRETAVCRECGKRDAFRNDHGHSDQWDHIFVDPTPVEALSFQAWCQEWATEALRVTKPGGYLLAFGGTRTHHRLVCGLEDAGWIIRDELTWVYASGFPKGRANLKPAHEPIVLARKPGPLRPLNIEETRIGTGDDKGVWPVTDREVGTTFRQVIAAGETDTTKGRWPSNLLLQDAALFDEPNPWVVGSGATTQGSAPIERPEGFQRFDGTDYNGGEAYTTGAYTSPGYADGGGYSRFFIIPKADRADREPVLRGQLAEQRTGAMQGNLVDGQRLAGNGTPIRTPMRENSHATVKPTDLMRHLIRLVTPPGGTVLDCFAGSGSTIVAAELEGFPWIAIEKEPEYVAIMEARLNGTQRGLGLDVGAPTKRIPYNDDKTRWPTRQTRTKRWVEWRENTQRGEGGEEPAA